MDTVDLHYKPTYSTPRHALVPKKCKFCHNDMEIKQINSTEAFRMCFKCPIPLQQLDLDDIEFFHRSCRDMLKSPLEWKTNINNEDDDLAKLPLWIEQMDLKVSKLEDGSDDETSENCADFTHQKSGSHKELNPSNQDSSYDWESEALNELDAALEKAQNEKLQPHNLPFSFDDFFLPDQINEKHLRPSGIAGLGSSEDNQELRLDECTGEISQDTANKHESKLCQSQLTRGHENVHSVEQLKLDVDLTDQIQQNNTNEDGKDKIIESIALTPFETTSKMEINLNKEKLDQENGYFVTPSVAELDPESEIPPAIIECLNEKSQEEIVKKSKSLSKTSEMEAYEENARELHTSEPCNFEQLSELRGDPLNTSENLNDTHVIKNKASEKCMEFEQDIEPFKQSICESSDVEAAADGESDEKSCAAVQEASLMSSPLAKHLLKNELSPISKNPSIIGDKNDTGNKSVIPSLHHQNIERFENPISESLSSASQVENEISHSTVVLTNKCGSSLPLSLWSSLSQCLTGNTLVYEHICDCDQEQIQLSPANNDDQCIDLALPDLSLTSLIEEDIRKSNRDSHSLDKVLFLPVPSSGKNKCFVQKTARKLDFHETPTEVTSEDHQAVPILVATVPADSDITLDMLQSIREENIPFFFEDSTLDVKASCLQNIASSENKQTFCSSSSTADSSTERAFVTSVTETMLDTKEFVPQNNVIPSATPCESQLCSATSPVGMTQNVEDFNRKTNFIPDFEERVLDSDDCVFNDNAVQETYDVPLQDLKEIDLTTPEAVIVSNEYCDVESYVSNSHCETSTYSQFSEGIDQTCSSSITVKQVRNPSANDKSFGMMIDRPLQLHGITVEEDDDELKCFSGSKFKPIGNRKPSLKEGKIESEPRVLNLLNSVRREIKMSEQPKIEKKVDV